MVLSLFIWELNLDTGELIPDQNLNLIHTKRRAELGPAWTFPLHINLSTVTKFTAKSTLGSSLNRCPKSYTISPI